MIQKFSRTLVSLSVLFPLVAAAGEPFEFETHTIGMFGNKLGQTSLVDVDKDGDLDWVVGERRGEARWYEYRAANDWRPHTIGNNADTDVGGTAFDVDGDGWVDHVAGRSWFRNPRNPRVSAFSRFNNGAFRAHDCVAADIDGDGKLDLISMSDRSGDDLVWFKIPSDATDDWEETRIGGGVHAGIDPRGCADLDGDGDVDVVRSNGWFENRNSGANWVWRGNIDGGNGTTLDGKYPNTTKAWIEDMDGDGDNDVVMTTADNDPAANNPWNVRWFENRNGDGSNWRTYDVAAGLGDVHSLAVADFDNDGDFDIFTGEGPLGGSGPGGDRRCFIYSRESGTNNWTEYIVAEELRCHEAKAGDVDGDGDVDIAFKPWNGSMHIYLENKLDPGSNPNPQPQPGPVTIGFVAPK